MTNGVEEIHINLIDSRDVKAFGASECCPPQPLYPCSWIRKLSLVACNLKIDGNVNWNQLKSLRIEGVCLSEDVMNQVLSGTPQLEVLMSRLMDSDDNLNIQSSSLKKLTIEKYLDVNLWEASNDRYSAENLSS